MISVEQNAPRIGRSSQGLIEEKLGASDYLNKDYGAVFELLRNFVPLGDISRGDIIGAKRDGHHFSAQARPIQTRRTVTFQLVPNQRRRTIARVLRDGRARQYAKQ
jgi:hypothetical protein